MFLIRLYRDEGKKLVLLLLLLLQFSFDFGRVRGPGMVLGGNEGDLGFGFKVYVIYVDCSCMLCVNDFCFYVDPRKNSCHLVCIFASFSLNAHSSIVPSFQWVSRTFMTQPQSLCSVYSKLLMH